MSDVMTGAANLGPEGAALTPLGPTRADRLALRVMQVGSVAVVLAASTNKLFELDRFFVPKELTLHLTALIAGLLAVSAFRRTRFTRVDLLLLAYLLLSTLSALLATNGWLAIRALAVSVSGVVIFWVARGLREAGLARPLLVTLALAIVIGTGTSLLQTYGVRTDLFSLNRAPGGTLGNRNFIAHMAAFGLPVVLLGALRAWRAAGYLLGSIGVMLVVASLVLTRSRAGWLAFGAVMLVFLLAMLLSRPLRRHWRTWGRLIGVLAMLAGGVAAAILVPNTLRWRSENPYVETVRGVANYQEGSGRGRLVQYQQSLRMALRHPMLGVGPGNWAVKYPEYAAPRDPSMDGTAPGMTANPWPSSDWVAFISERGIPAVIALILALFGIGRSALSRLLRARDPDEALTAAALLGTLAAALVAGAFDAVLLVALPTLLVWAALGALWSPESSPPAPFARSAQAIALLVLALAAGGGAARSAAQLVSIGIYGTGGDRSRLALAARIDPGNYRAHLALARTGRGEQRCTHARRAHALYPSADQARNLSRRCDD